MSSQITDFKAQLEEHRTVIASLEKIQQTIEQAAARMVRALRERGKVLWAGNGGSAADSQHLAAELVGRYRRERAGLASVALTTDTSVLTAIANDYGYERVFSRQIEALCQPHDVFVAITTSGNSPNILAAVAAARAIGAFTIGMCGKGGRLRDAVDLCISVDSTVAARIQEGHIFIGHFMCDLVEQEFAVAGVPHV